MSNQSKSFHTPAPWGIHPFSENAEPMVVDPGAHHRPWVSFNLTISSGKRIVGELKMGTMQISEHSSYLYVDNVRELRANVERVCELINICEGLTIDEVKLAIGAYHELSMREDPS